VGAAPEVQVELSICTLAALERRSQCWINANLAVIGRDYIEDGGDAGAGVALDDGHHVVV